MSEVEPAMQPMLRHPLPASGASPREVYDASYFARFYPASWFHAAGDKPAVNYALSSMLRRLCVKYRRGRHRPVLVHFGCGEGFLARACRRWSTNVGCDIAQFAAGRATGNGVPSVCASLEAGCFRPGAFDAATAIDVLEHLIDPRTGLRTLWDALRPGGLALVTVPNLASLSRKLKGCDWSAYRDRTHRCLVAPGTWRGWFEAAGFEVVRVGTDALWDPPYFDRWLRPLERLAILSAANLLALVRLQLPWSLGDNLVVTLRKPA
jgi:SAM-dependent methyltransferase